MPRELIPLFKSGDILTGEMLFALKDHAINFGDNLYAGYSDGVVTGCGLSFTADAITLNRGLVRFDGNLYQISECLSAAYAPTDTWMVCKLRFEPELVTESYIIRGYAFLITPLEERVERDLEICRFKLQRGSRLRADYVSFEDRITGYDTVNTVYGLYAAYGCSTLAPDILMAFSSEAMQYRLSQPLDFSFCVTVLASHGAVTRDVLECYVLCRKGLPKQALSNEQLFNFLVEILNAVRDMGEREIITQQKKRHMIMVE